MKMKVRVRYEGIQTGGRKTFPLYTVVDEGEHKEFTFSDRSLRQKFNVRAPGKGLAQAFLKKGQIIELEVLE